MKLPEEIKKGLELCAIYSTKCEECPYTPDHDYNMEDFLNGAPFCNNNLVTDALEYIEQLEQNQPKRGKWEPQFASAELWCSCCSGWFVLEPLKKNYKYCPNCGAKMEENG